MKWLATPTILLTLMGTLAACPRDPHPERTPQPSPSADWPLQTGRQPAPSASCSTLATFNGKLPGTIEICDRGRS